MNSPTWANDEASSIMLEHGCYFISDADFTILSGSSFNDLPARLVPVGPSICRAQRSNPRTCARANRLPHLARLPGRGW
jgi:hypothetical protein